MEFLTEFFEDLQSPEYSKLQSGLSRLLQFLTKVDQPVVFSVATLVKYTLSIESKSWLAAERRNIRLLTYQVLRRAPTFPEAKWSAVVPFLLKDVATEDHELLCASLRLLQILPGSVVFGMKEKLPLEKIMKHDEHVVRQACLMFMHQLALQPEFRLWAGFRAWIDLGVTVAVDDLNPKLFVDSLLLLDSYVSCTEDACAQPLALSLLTSIPHLLTRLPALPSGDRHIGYSLITKLLTDYLPITLAESNLHPYLANPHSLVMSVLDSLSKLLPAGGVAGVRFSLAHSMLVLSRSPISQSTLHIPAAVQALQMVLVHPDTGSTLRLRIVEDLLTALPLVDLATVSGLATLLVSSLGSLPADPSMRLVSLIDLMKTCCKRNLARAKNAPCLMTQLFESAAFLAEWNRDGDYRGELLLALVEAITAVAESYPASQRLSTVFPTIRFAIRALGWDYERYKMSFDALVACLHSTLFVPGASSGGGGLGGSSSGGNPTGALSDAASAAGLDPLYQALLDALPTCESPVVLGQLAMLLVRSLPASYFADGAATSLLKIISERLLPPVDFWSRREADIKALQEKGDFLPIEPSNIPRSVHAHALPAIYLLALRHAYIMEALTLLSNMKTVYSIEPQIATRLDMMIYHLQKALPATRAVNAKLEKSATVPLPPTFPAPTVSFDSGLEAGLFLARALRASLAKSGVPYTSRPPPTLSNFQGPQLTGGSDPLRVEATHVVHAQQRRVTFYLRCTNITNVKIYYLALHVSLSGAMDFLDSMPVLKAPSGLAPHASVLLQCDLRLTGFGAPQLVLRADVSSLELNELDSLDGYPTFQTVYCEPYTLNPSELLVPLPLSGPQFSALWGYLPAAFVLNLVLPPGAKLSEFTTRLAASSFKRVSSKIYGTKNNFHALYSGMSVFDDILLFGMFANLDIRSTRWHVRLEFQCSALSTRDVFKERIDGWVRDLGGVVEILSGDGDASIFNETSGDCLSSEHVLSSTVEVLGRWKALRAEPAKS